MRIMQYSLHLIDKLVRKLPKWWLNPPVNDDGIPLSSGLYVMTKLRKLTGATQLDKMSVKKARKKINFDLTSVLGKFPVAESNNIVIDLKGRELNARHYRPTNSKRSALMVYFHGGGWVTGNLNTHDDVCRLLCEKIGIQILSVDYRQPPEYRFPDPLDDAIDSVKWAQRNASRFGISPSSIAVGGDSAGGNFAAVVAQDTDLEYPLLGQLLLYPCVDRSVDWPSRTKYTKGLFLSAEESEWFYNHYLGGEGKELNNPLVAPIKGSVSASTAPALVVTAGFDILSDEGSAYAKWLQQNGVTVRHKYFANLVHAFLNLAAVNEDCYDAALITAYAFGELLDNNTSTGERYDRA